MPQHGDEKWNVSGSVDVRSCPSSPIMAQGSPHLRRGIQKVCVYVHGTFTKIVEYIQYVDNKVTQRNIRQNGKEEAIVVIRSSLLMAFLMKMQQLKTFTKQLKVSL
mmetsp:Transcript_7824/g.10709  ORF Transcript_7824/g.10709 Transcript_7824/m.10709 type:complete len:106 (-) Transcript_7824:68-385(-)